MDNNSLEKEAYQLVRGHIAPDIEEAKKILIALEEKREKADLAVFYTDQRAKDILTNDLIDERNYNYSNIRMGLIRSGSLAKFSKIEYLAFGKIMEFAPLSNKYPIRLTALIKNFKYQEKEGVFIIGAPAEEVKKIGGITFDERYPKSLYRMEFEPIGKDPLFGMFAKWNEEVNEQASLILYMYRNKILFI